MALDWGVCAFSAGRPGRFSPCLSPAAISSTTSIWNLAGCNKWRSTLAQFQRSLPNGLWQQSTRADGKESGAPGVLGAPRSACLIFPARNDTFPDRPDRSWGRGDHHQRFIWVLSTNNHMWTLHIVILFMNFNAVTVHSQQLLCICTTCLLRHSSGLCCGSWLHVLRWQTGNRLFSHVTLSTSQYHGTANTQLYKEIIDNLDPQDFKQIYHYFGHLMRRADSLEKTLMRGKIEGRRRRGRQRMRWLECIIDSMNMSLSKL